MYSALSLRPLHPFAISIPSADRFIRRPYLFFSSSSISSTLTLDSDRPLPYGPFLRKGRKPPLSPTPDSDEDGGSIDKSSFSRSFDVAALRVPAEECSSLESRLRGHLLNWPRVRNVARVPGDDIEPDFKRILRDSSGDGGDRLNSLAGREIGRLDGEREVLSPVLYREKLAKDFNCRGFVKFRNLAKISRPKKKKKKEGERGGFEVKERVGKNDFSVVEVVGNGEEEGEDFSGLLGDEFRGVRWRGPTRLLLLDEQYAKKGVEELPQAVKVALILCELLSFECDQVTWICSVYMLHVLFHFVYYSKI